MLFALTKGKYWIVLLDEENYEYAVVRITQFTLFVLSCTEMDKDRSYSMSLEAAGGYIRLKVTGTLNYGGQTCGAIGR